MICPTCWEEVAEREVRCPFCGSLVSQEKPPSAQSLPSASVGAPPAMRGQPRRASPLAIASLIFGLLGPLGILASSRLRVYLGYRFPPFASLVWLLGAALLAVIFGHLGRRSVRRSEGRLLGKRMAAWGLVLGYAVLGFVGWLLVEVLYFGALHSF